MLDIMRTENIMQAVNESAKLSTNDEKLKVNLEKALEISKQLDRTSLGVAYHLANCEQYLQGNASGFSTDFAEFCEQSLGLKRAQAFNVKLVGSFVETYTASDGTECYIDSFTMGLAIREYSKLHNIKEDDINSDEQWKQFIESLETRRSLGQTQILTISRAMGKRAINTKDIIDLLQIGTISADTTIKSLDSILNGKFKAIPAKDKTPEKTPKTPEKTPKTPEKTPKTPDKTPDDTPSVTITCTFLNRISAVLSIYTETDVNAAGLYKELLDIPEFAEYLNNLQNAKKGGKKK